MKLESTTFTPEIGAGVSINIKTGGGLKNGGKDQWGGLHICRHRVDDDDDDDDDDGKTDC